MRKGLLFTGLALTAAYLTLIYWMLGAKLLDFEWLELNEAGDFLTGVFGPLTVLWLVLGFMQQGEELRLQAQELKNSVDQHRRMADIAQKDHEATLLAHQHSLEQLRTQRDAERRQVQPHLFVESQGSVAGGTPVARYNYRIVNGGRECSRIRVALSKDSSLMLVTPKETAILGNGQQFHLQFVPRAMTESFSGVLSVAYVDLLGNEGAVNFRLRPDMEFEQIA